MQQPALAALGSRAAVLTLILGYLALHLAVRLLTSPTLGIDDAEQALFAQRWAWGYQARQPPLYTWLLLPVIDLAGVGRLALSVVRYLLLGVTSACMRWRGAGSATAGWRRSRRSASRRSTCSATTPTTT